MDPFAVLDIKRRFDLDEAELHRRFIAASAATHPDRYTDPLDQADAAERAALVNEAYRTLKDPESRANALLLLLGGKAKEADKSLPPDLLMQMMEVRERMEEAVAGRDEAALGELRRWAQRERTAHLTRVGEHFARFVQSSDAAELDAVRTELNAMRYIERMLEQMPGAGWGEVWAL